MNLIFRLLRVIIAAFFRSKAAVLEETRVTFRVLPNDLDLNFHMNNGRYLTLMDLGRMDFTVRAGVIRPMVKRRWHPVVGAETILFKRGLQPFQKFELTTRMLGWDEKWLFIEQRFLIGDRVCATAWVKALFRDGSRNVPVPTKEILMAIGHEGHSPQLPSGLVDWVHSTENMIS